MPYMDPMDHGINLLPKKHRFQAAFLRFSVFKSFDPRHPRVQTGLKIPPRESKT